LQDALDEIARQRPKDLFKPLRVHFIQEAGIDAGGLKKEFFQLLLTELLCPDYGMLIFQPVRFSIKFLCRSSCSPQPSSYVAGRYGGLLCGFLARRLPTCRDVRSPLAETIK